MLREVSGIKALADLDKRADLETLAEALMLKAPDLGQRWMKGVSREFALKRLREQPVPWYHSPSKPLFTIARQVPGACACPSSASGRPGSDSRCQIGAIWPLTSEIPMDRRLREALSFGRTLDVLVSFLSPFLYWRGSGGGLDAGLVRQQDPVRTVQFSNTGRVCLILPVEPEPQSTFAK